MTAVWSLALPTGYGMLDLTETPVVVSRNLIVVNEKGGGDESIDNGFCIILFGKQ